jgi:hypothetical protein
MPQLISLTPVDSVPFPLPFKGEREKRENGNSRKSRIGKKRESGKTGKHSSSWSMKAVLVGGMIHAEKSRHHG